MTRVLVLNGPNLGRLGVREPEVYGTGTLAELESAVQAWGSELGLTIEARQSDSESELVGWLHEAADTRAHVALNAAALTHYSYALRDAAAEVTDAGLVLVEVHISNPAAREQFRHTSVLAAVTTGAIAGFGFDSYRLGLLAIAHRTASSSEQGA